MRLNGKNILLISPEPWDHIFVSKHNYARYLAEQGNYVFFANPPKSKWKLEESQIERLTILDYPRFLKGLRKFPKHFSAKLILKKFKEIEKVCQVKIDIIWSFDNSIFFDFSMLPTFNISHIVDLNQNFETEKAAQTADICFYTTKYIGQRLRRFNTNSHFINHGYNEKSVGETKKLPGKQRFKILYAGNLNMRYLDWENMKKAVLEVKEADFIFIGPLDQTSSGNNLTWDSLGDILENDRTHFLGRVNADDLPSYYNAADILTICYQEDHHNDQSNPHKMMEYLGAGRCIVATNTQGYTQYKKPLIIMTVHNEDFSHSVQLAIDNLEEWNSPQVCEDRRSIALDNSYPKQIQRIENFINNSHE